MQSGEFWKRSRSIFKRICALPLIALVKFYQLCISPFTPPSCRFTPTCSQYALEALRKHGLLKGSWLTLRRLSRCHPWGGSQKRTVTLKWAGTLKWPCTLKHNLSADDAPARRSPYGKSDPFRAGFYFENAKPGDLKGRAVCESVSR